MVEPGDGVLIGLSGGADSVGLLLVLWKLREMFQISLRALHVHHGLRGAEADRDAAFSKELCERLEVPFYEFRIDAAKEARDRKCSVEEAGRLARYRLYEETARAWEKEMWSGATSANLSKKSSVKNVVLCEAKSGSAKEVCTKKAGRRGQAALRVHVATAHHADDNAETILFNLFRGSGLTGLSGIASVRGRIIRPLLWAQRSEIQVWLRQQGQDWVEDSTNQESEYSRNWLRNELIPSVKEHLNAQAVRHIDQAGRRIRQADAYLEEVAEKWLQEHAPDGKVDAGALAEQAEIVQGYIVRCFFMKSGMPLRDVTETHIEAVRELVHQGTGKSVSLPHRFRAVNTYGMIEIIMNGQEKMPANCAPLPVLLPQKEDSQEQNFQTFQNNKLLQMHIFLCKNRDQFPKNKYAKWFDYDKIKGTLSLRHRQPGDYLTLPSGGRKTLKSWMIDEKIPRQEREKIWLLAEEKHILWIVGHRISAYYKITEQTTTILEVEFNGGKSSG